MVQDLISDDSNHLEGLSRRDRVHQHVTMDADEVLGVQLAVIVLEHVRHESGSCGNGGDVLTLLLSSESA